MFSVVRLINIQSFEDVTFHFTNGVNVLTAPNETGKSIIFKVCRLMCDANWYGRGEAKSVIRRGCDKGTALFVVPHSDGVFKIVFELYKTYQVYRLFDGDEPIDKWKQNTLPDEIRDILGWRYDSSSKILLNLCDQELDMPFVNSNEKYNFDALRFIIQDQDLERTRFNIAEWIRELTNSINNVSMTNENLKGKASALEYINVNGMEYAIESSKKQVTIAQSALKMIEGLDGCLNCVRPEITEIDTSMVEQDIDLALKLRDVGLLLQEVLTAKKPEIKTVDGSLVEDYISICRILNSLKFDLNDQLKNIDKYNTAVMYLNNSKECLEKFESEHKFCPLCGSRFGGDHCE